MGANVGTHRRCRRRGDSPRPAAARQACRGGRGRRGGRDGRGAAERRRRAWSIVPVIACPTSVGYGASFGGVAALLTMLNSCSAGVTRGEHRRRVQGRVRRSSHCSSCSESKGPRLIVAGLACSHIGFRFRSLMSRGDRSAPGGARRRPDGSRRGRRREAWGIERRSGSAAERSGRCAAPHARGRGDRRIVEIRWAHRRHECVAA